MYSQSSYLSAGIVERVVFFRGYMGVFGGPLSEVPTFYAWVQGSW